MKRNSFLQKIASGKGFYVAIIMSVCVIVFAVSLIYRTSTNMLKDILTVPDDITQQARQNETDEADPRYENGITLLPAESTEEETTVRVETSPRWNSTDAEKITENETEATEAAIVNESYILPLGSDIIRDFSPDIPIYDSTMGDWRTHCGVDFYGEEGASVKSIGNGKVIRVLSDKSYGFIIEIDHGDFIARYCGLSQENALKLNDTVEKGDTVGTLLSIPCEAAQESHLHFEVIKGGVPVEPLETMGF